MILDLTDGAGSKSVRRFSYERLDHMVDTRTSLELLDLPSCLAPPSLSGCSAISGWTLDHMVGRTFP